MEGSQWKKNIDSVWRNSRTAFLRCLPSYEGLHRAPSCLCNENVAMCVWCSCPEWWLVTQAAFAQHIPEGKSHCLPRQYRHRQLLFTLRESQQPSQNSGSQGPAVQTGLSKESGLKTAVLTLFSTELKLYINCNISVLQTVEGTHH